MLQLLLVPNPWVSRMPEKTLDMFPIQLEHVRKVYPCGKVAVSGLSLAISRGEVVGLLGPNGAGKSTTLKVLATILRPTSGKLLVGPTATSVWDESETELLSFKRRVGWMSEVPLLYDRLTAYEYLRFIGALLEIPKDELNRKIEWAVEYLQLDQCANEFIVRYSHGTQRKVSLAACLLNDPDFLLMDEPTGGMDPQSVRRIKDIIADCKRRGKAVLVSTHILDTAEKICDRVAIMSRGETVFVGDVDKLRTELLAPSNAGLEDLFLELTRQPARESDAVTPTGAERR